jgi:hypothetical protein
MIAGGGNAVARPDHARAASSGEACGGLGETADMWGLNGLDLARGRVHGPVSAQQLEAQSTALTQAVPAAFCFRVVYLEPAVNLCKWELCALGYFFFISFAFGRTAFYQLLSEL